MDMDFTRYSRHILLPRVGMEGQRKLNQASVLIIGAGGLGSPISLYLAAAGVGRIGLVDPDQVTVSNLQRQILYSTSQAGEDKVIAAKRRLTDLNPGCQVDIFPTTFTAQNARDIAEGFDSLVDGTDNLTTRYLINDLCVLTGRPYVFGAIQQFEGQVALFDARVGPCYRCVFGVPPAAEHIPLPSDSGVFGVIPGLVGLLQAAEVLKIILGIGDTLARKLVLINSLTSSFEHIEVQKEPSCPVCGESPEIDSLLDYEQHCGATYANQPVALPDECELTPAELADRLDSGVAFTLVDLRTDVEREISHIPGAVPLPYHQLGKKMDDFDRESQYVLFCRAGKTSAWAVKRFHQAGFNKVSYLKGGINAWVEETDPSMPQY